MFEFWGWIPSVLLDVVVVVVERRSGPVSGFGCTRTLFGVHLDCFCMRFNRSSNIVSKQHYKRKVIHRTPLFVVFCRVLILGVDSWVLLVVVVVVVVVLERGWGPVSGFGCTRSFFGVHLD